MAGTLLKMTMAAFLAVGIVASASPQPAEAQSSSKKAKPLTGKSYYGRRGATPCGSPM